MDLEQCQRSLTTGRTLFLHCIERSYLPMSTCAPVDTLFADELAIPPNFRRML